MRLIVLLAIALCFAGCTRYKDGTVVWHKPGQTHHRAADGTITWTKGNAEARAKTTALLDKGDGTEARERRQQGDHD